MMSQNINLKKLRFYLDTLGISSLLIFIGLIINNGYVNEFKIGFNLIGISSYVGVTLFLIIILCGISSEVLKKLSKS